MGKETFKTIPCLVDFPRWEFLLLSPAEFASRPGNNCYIASPQILDHLRTLVYNLDKNRKNTF